MLSALNDLQWTYNIFNTPTNTSEPTNHWIPMNTLQNEWSILHQNIEKYEYFSLIIKLFSVLICLLSIVHTLNIWINLLFIFILWLQNGVWKTFQSRLESRVLFIEQQLLNKATPEKSAFQLYSQWQDERQSPVILLKEYCINALKPTVAYPYLFLMAVVPAINMTLGQ